MFDLYDKVIEMNHIQSRSYPKWRRKCCECKFLGHNSPDGIWCKTRLLKEEMENSPKCWDVDLIPKDTEPFECKMFQEWKNPITKTMERKNEIQKYPKR